MQLLIFLNKHQIINRNYDMNTPGSNFKKFHLIQQFSCNNINTSFNQSSKHTPIEYQIHAQVLAVIFSLAHRGEEHNKYTQ